MILRIERDDAVEHVSDPSLIGPNYVSRVKAIECEERSSDEPVIGADFVSDYSWYCRLLTADGSDVA